MREMQATELRDDEEQDQHQGTPGVEEVLPVVPGARVAQRDALALSSQIRKQAGPKVGFFRVRVSAVPGEVPVAAGLRLPVMTPAEMEGLVIGPMTHNVDRQRVRTFVDVTGDDPDRWIEHAPPGYAAALLFAVVVDFLTDTRIAPYLATLIHVDQQFTYPAPIDIGSDVQMTGTVQRVRERTGAYFVTFVAEGRTGDRVVLESRSTFLMSDQAATDMPTEESEPLVGGRGENQQAGAPLPAGSRRARPRAVRIPRSACRLRPDRT